MTYDCEVAVVGAGMFGAAAGKHLSRAGADVMIIGPAEPRAGDPVSQHSFGAHFDEARITRRLGWDPVWEMTDARSQERYRDIEHESGISFFHECGSLVLMANSIAHRTNAILDQCAAAGIAVDQLSEEDLRDQFPDLGLPPIQGGVMGLLEREQAGHLNPRRLVSAQLTLATAAGARLVRGAVTGVERVPGGWLLRTDGAGCPPRIRAERVLVATGAFTNVNNVLPVPHQLDLRAFTEPNLLFEVHPEQLDRLRTLPSVVTVDPADTGDANTSLYLLPPIRYPDGKWYMRCGPGMQPLVEELRTVDEMVSWYSNQKITARQMAFLTTMTHLMVPNLKPVSVREACCIIEKTPSRYPYIGHVDEDFAVVVGGNGHGARGSDEIGRLASTVVLGEPWDCPIPQDVFAPLTASPAADDRGERPEFLKPPFGLC